MPLLQNIMTAKEIQKATYLFYLTYKTYKNIYKIKKDV